MQHQVFFSTSHRQETHAHSALDTVGVGVGETSTKHSASRAKIAAIKYTLGLEVQHYKGTVSASHYPSPRRCSSYWRKLRYFKSALLLFSLIALIQSPPLSSDSVCLPLFCSRKLWRRTLIIWTHRNNRSHKTWQRNKRLSMTSNTI